MEIKTVCGFVILILTYFKCVSEVFNQRKEKKLLKSIL